MPTFSPYSKWQLVAVEIYAPSYTSKLPLLYISSATYFRLLIIYFLY